MCSSEPIAEASGAGWRQGSPYQILTLADPVAVLPMEKMKKLIYMTSHHYLILLLQLPHNFIVKVARS